MSWQNNIENIYFKIETGDGKEFTPLWRKSGKTKEFNTAIYDFINIDGSYVDRKKTKSAKHTFIFFFQGENHIDDANEFDLSANDPRAWTITHPVYGTLNGQPLSIDYNEDDLNITTVTVEFWESITSDFPVEKVAVKDRTALKVENVLSDSSTVFASDVVPVTADITKIKELNELTAASFDSLLTNDNLTEFSNALSKAQSSADNLLNNPLNAISDAQSLMVLPSIFNSPVLSKVNAYVSAFNSLKESIETVSDKLFFESQAAACVSGLCNSTVLPLESDYVIRTEIEDIVEIILNVYNEYLNILDQNQVQIYDVDNTYIPNVNTQTQLYSLVAFTTGNLYNLAFEAKQERIVYTKKNTNVYLLAHQYLGLDENDENLNNFIKINGIVLDELFVIKKDRQIKFFV